MAESSCINMAMNVPTALINREAYTSLQLLHRLSSDEENTNDEAEEEEEEEQKNGEAEDIEEESGDSPVVVESDNDHLNHSASAPVLSSSPSFYYPVGRASGSRLKSIVLPFDLIYSCINSLNFRALLIRPQLRLDAILCRFLVR